MADFEFLTKDLNEEHQIALEHFSRNIGREQIRFPESLPNGQRLATQAKGIYKPEGWIYALSIRVMLNSPYEDGEFTNWRMGVGFARITRKWTDAKLGHPTPFSPIAP